MSMFHRTITVRPGEQYVEYLRGAFTEVLDSGEHKRPWHATHVRVPLRESLVSVAPKTSRPPTG